jgi:non-homologous end joining protein Ku
MALPGSQHVLVLLDCRPEMFQQFLPGDPKFPDEKYSPMDVALAACENLVRAKVRTMTTLKTGKRDGFGVVFYNTRLVSRRENSDKDNDADDKKPAMNDDDGDGDDDDDDGSVGYGPRDELSTVHELLPLAPPGKQSVLTIKSALNKDPFSDGLDIEEEYGHPAQDTKSSQDKEDHVETNPLDLAFHHVIQLFSNAKCVKKPKTKYEPVDSKSLWIFTNDDDPTSGRFLGVLKKKVSDMQEMDIDITIWPLPTAPSGPTAPSATPSAAAAVTEDQPTFSYEKFYDEIGADTPAKGKSMESMTELLEELAAYFKLTRRAFGAPMFMPDWKNATDRPAVMLDFYRLVQQSTFPAKVQIHQETGRYVYCSPYGWLDSLLLGRRAYNRIEYNRIQYCMHSHGVLLTVLYPFFRELARVTQRVTAESDILESAVSGPGSKLISAEVGSGRTAEYGRVRTYVELGGERVPMSLDDKAIIRIAGNANESGSLILLGFKDKNAIPFTHTLEATYFAYPDDKTVEGSSSAFAHLHAAMLRKNVVAIGELLTRAKGMARLVAMSPLEEELCTDEIDGQEVLRLKSPPGMVVVALPFEDEMRAMDPDAAVRSLETGGAAIATENVVNAAMALIRKQTIPNVEIGENFENATLSKFWDYVEHVALAEGPPDKQEEYDTVVDKERVLKDSGEQITALKESLPPDVVVKAETAGSKRKIEPDDSGVDWELMFAEGRLSDLKNDQLKKKLRSVPGAKLSGNKNGK